MRIFNLKETKEHGQIKLSVSIKSQHLGLKELWFSTPEKYDHYLCKTRLDGFLVGMVFPAMQYGEDIHLEGCVSKKLLFNLNNYVIPLLISFSTSSNKIKIIAEDLSAERFDCHGVGTGFSGGIDSFCTIYDRYELETDSDYKINSLIFLNVGSHGPFCKEQTNTKYEKRYHYLKKYPDEIGLEFIPLDSNLHLFHPWGHQLTCTLTMTSGVLLMQKYFNKYYCSSLGWSYLELFKYYETELNKDVSVFDPVLLPLISTESLEFISDGIQYTRTEKLKKIINYEPVYRFLNVCVSGEKSHKNCSICSKCCRTLMTLNSLGKLDKFSHLFDVKKYKKNAELKYVCQQLLLKKKDPFAQDNIDLAEERGVKLPSTLACYAVWSTDIIKHFLIKLVKYILPKDVIKKIIKVVRFK